MSTLTLGEETAQQLELWADQLLTGRIGIQDLPSAIAAFFHLGASDSKLALSKQIRELEHECDRLYLAATHPTERAAELQQRLDDHFNNEAERFFTPYPKAIAI